MKELIKNSILTSDEKTYWLDLLPTMSIDQQEKLGAILTKSGNIKNFNENYLVNYKE